MYKVTREDTYRALSYAVEGYHTPYIWDRLGPFSDPIYSRVQNRDNAFSPAEAKFCEDIIRVIRCPVIICSVPLDVATENQEKVHQMEGVGDNFKDIWEFYLLLYERMVAVYPNLFLYDYRVPTAYDEVMGRVRKYLEKRKVREWH